MMLRTPPANRRACLPSPPAPTAEEEVDGRIGNEDDRRRSVSPLLQPVKSEVSAEPAEQPKDIADILPQAEYLQNSDGSAEKGVVEQIEGLEHEEAVTSVCEREIKEKYIREMERVEEMYRVQFKRCQELEVKLQQEMRHRSEAEIRLNAAFNQIVSIECELNKTKEESKTQILWLEECINRLQKDVQQDASKANIEKSAETSRVQIAEAEVQTIQSECNHLQQRLSEESVVKEATRAKQIHASVKLLEENLEIERLRAERAEAALMELQSQNQNDLEMQNQRLKRKVDLLTKERDGLQVILSSYDEEDVILSSRNKMDIGVSTSENAKENLIQELKALIDNLQQEGEMLRLDLAKAETKLGRGDYDPLSTRVVHMVENLDFKSEKQVLLAEIQSLREKLKSVEDNRLNEGMECSQSTEMSLLRKQVISLEKREARYKKVFAEKISLFRQACCLLFGYMVEMSEEQQVSTGMTVTLFTLQSIYAQNEDETMEFLLESNRMNLRATKYVSSPEISRMVDVYCKKFKSIPAFTANLTSELFNRSTCN